MGTDVKVRLLGKVGVEEIANFVTQRYGFIVELRVEKNFISYEIDWEHLKYGDEKPYYESGFVYFRNKNETTGTMFYIYTNTNSLENIDYYSKHGLENMVLSETTDLSMHYCEENVEIMKALVTEFGGWIDENDCDDESYYRVFQNTNDEIKPIIYVTMEDIYEKFGGFVVIKKER